MTDDPQARQVNGLQVDAEALFGRPETVTARVEVQPESEMVSAVPSPDASEDDSEVDSENDIAPDDDTAGESKQTRAEKRAEKRQHKEARSDRRADKRDARREASKVRAELRSELFQGRRKPYMIRVGVALGIGAIVGADQHSGMAFVLVSIFALVMAFVGRPYTEYVTYREARLTDGLDAAEALQKVEEMPE